MTEAGEVEEGSEVIDDPAAKRVPAGKDAEAELADTQRLAPPPQERPPQSWGA